MQLVRDGLHGHARLPFEDEVLRQASQDIMERLKRKGYGNQPSRHVSAIDLVAGQSLFHSRVGLEFRLSQVLSRRLRRNAHPPTD